MLKSGITKQKTFPDVPAANLDHLKELLKIEDESEDDYLTRQLMAATIYAQNYLNRSLIYTTWQRQYDMQEQSRGLRQEYRSKPWAVLPYTPLKEITKIVTVDRDGDETPITSYYLDDVSEPERVYITKELQGREIAYLLIEYQSGYGPTYEDIPFVIQQGILQHAAYMAEHRGDCGAKEAARESGATNIYGMMKVELI